MSNVKTMSFFPVPISFCNFGKEAKELNEQLIADAVNRKISDPNTAGRSAIDGWQSEADMDLDYESYSILNENIKKIIFNLLPKYGFDETVNYDEVFECNKLWSNILTNQSAYHIPHIHGTGETIFSGVYYPTSGLTDAYEDFYPDEDYDDVEIRASSVPESGDLVLFDPASAVKRQVIPGFVKRYPFYGSEICIRPKKSHLIIFPNYLTHMVAPITKPNFIRLSISFSFRKKTS